MRPQTTTTHNNTTKKCHHKINPLSLWSVAHHVREEAQTRTPGHCRVRSVLRHENLRAFVFGVTATFACFFCCRACELSWRRACVPERNVALSVAVSTRRQGKAMGNGRHDWDFVSLLPCGYGLGSSASKVKQLCHYFVVHHRFLQTLWTIDSYNSSCIPRVKVFRPLALCSCRRHTRELCKRLHEIRQLEYSRIRKS